MGLRDVKAKVLACLEAGAVSHEQRSSIDIKNRLATGQFTLHGVAAVIGQDRGNQYRSSPHHLVSSVDVHVITARRKGKDWYIKWYFVEPDCVFISVHH